MTQLALDVDPPAPSRANPNAHMFDAAGRPKRLLWCSDTARLGGLCPYTDARARFMPSGGCCKDLAKATA